MYVRVQMSNTPTYALWINGAYFRSFPSRAMAELDRKTLEAHWNELTHVKPVKVEIKETVHDRENP